MAWGLFISGNLRIYFSDGINVSLGHKTFVMPDVMDKTNFNSPTFRSIKEREIKRMGYFETSGILDIIRLYILHVDTTNLTL